MWSRVSSARGSLRALHWPLIRRRFSTKPAEFITLDAQGLRVTQKTNVWMGDPHEAFVLVPKEISDGMKGSSQDEICPLIFHHDSKHFSSSGLSYLVTRSVNRASSYLESASYPRLEIPQNLPRQSNANTSPATLYLFGVNHTVALDGTPDGKLHMYIRLSLVAYLLQRYLRDIQGKPYANWGQILTVLRTGSVIWFPGLA